MSSPEGVLPSGVLPQLDTFAAAVERCSSWDWLVLRSENRLLLTTDHSVSAVEMAAGIGEEVRHYLSVRMLGGPVVALPGASGRWLVLTESADEASQVNLIRLRARGALTHRLGTLVPLPPSRIDGGGVRWLGDVPSGKPFLPPFSAVVAAVRAVTETAGSR
ncbi:hypothetical protein [Lentzea jiangxiensis]|uniref:Bifunctional DNA primase/polymerase, N-terminal n=1 Tax=Lentzea jiangxiensis TaxID=641025 RepID=A0A1H0WRA6_9PSEU|nr:hypothetical protein [Lentzea jiangxiensis]SDP93172.1 hypothetical protein SAMN05421507_121119 [Lentzea jiangxiensis]